MQITTDYIILRKTPYKETSLILAGISRKLGRSDLLVKGALKTSSKKLPAIDLFREITISVAPEKQGLHPVYSAELVSNFDNVADNRGRFETACGLSRFLLSNLYSGIPAPATYNALKTALESLINIETNCFFHLSLVKLIFLKEHGMLPEINPGQRAEEAELLENLLNAAAGKTPLPALTDEYMEKIAAWTDNICRFNELK
jgi:DNA repair protein RecO